MSINISSYDVSVFLQLKHKGKSSIQHLTPLPQACSTPNLSAPQNRSFLLPTFHISLIHCPRVWKIFFPRTGGMASLLLLMGKYSTGTSILDHTSTTSVAGISATTCWNAVDLIWTIWIFWIDGYIHSSKFIPIPRGCIGFPKHIYHYQRWFPGW